MPKPKRETPFTTKTKTGELLTKKEELFCQLYIMNMGNGAQAAMEAYDVKGKNAYQTARAIACENLTKPHLLQRIKEIFDDKGLNDQIVDAETSFLVKQNADLKSKGKGIDIYNKIKGRYAEDNKQRNPFGGLSKAELEERAAELITGIISNSGGAGKEK